MRGTFKCNFDESDANTDDGRDPDIFYMHDSKSCRDSASVENGILNGADWIRLIDEIDEWSDDKDPARWDEKTPDSEYASDDSLVSDGSDELHECN